MKQPMGALTLQTQARAGQCGRAHWRIAAALLALCAASTASAGPRFMFGPYKHAPLVLDAATQRLSTAVTGAPRPVPAVLPAGVGTVSWAFATGECGQETWGPGIDTARFARANVEAFRRAGVGYIVSTGGAGGRFSCGSDEGMERFIARYDSPRLAGVDLDIEASQSDDDIDALVLRVQAAQRRRPRLRFSFTLPTFAAEDAGAASLNAIGQRVMAAIERHHLRGYFINLMVMDYGEAEAAHCVLKPTREGPRCDMGRSGLQAALNLHAHYGVPLERIELTAMIGVNDVAGNVFTLEDARRLARDARAHGLAGAHYWSLDRDVACPAPSAAAQPDCSGLAQPPLGFARAFVSGWRGH